MRSKVERGFIRWSVASIISLLVLILAGGIVRSSGSGMGCPDWPRCFNRYIPPTNVGELPSDYKAAFLRARLRKNIRAAAFFNAIGFRKLAADIKSDPAVSNAESFNVWNTYTEYVNRLASVVVGIFFIIAWIYSINYISTKKVLFVIWSLGIVLIAVQGWLGSIVVSTNLFAWLITIHMLLALIILVLAISGYTLASGLAGKFIGNFQNSRLFNGFLLGLIFLTTIQILTGTQVREKIDIVSAQFEHQHRNEWVGNVGITLNWHVYLSVAVSIGVLVLYLSLYYGEQHKLRLYKVARINVILIGIQLLTGTLLATLALPPVNQALHIFVASLMFGNLVYIFLLGFNRSIESSENRQQLNQVSV